MLFIIGHHYVVNSALLDVILPNMTSMRSLFLLIFGAWGKTGINCFVLITGYFMCTSHITVRKYVKLIFEILLYNILFFLIFTLTGYERFSVTGLITAVLPVLRLDGFTSCYLVFYLFIPFLNLLIRSMNERTHLRLAVLLLLVFTFLGSVPDSSVPANYVVWFTVLYILASYLRLYPREIFNRTRLWGAVTAGVFAVSVASIVVMTYLAVLVNKTGFRYPHWFIADSNKILAVALSGSAFLFFKNLRIRQSRFIYALGASTFGVLMIHANSDAMRRFLWQDVLDNAGMYASPYMPLHAFGSVIAVFAVCAAIDQLRIRFIERPFFRVWDRHWPGMREKYLHFETQICKKLNIKES